MDQEDVYEVKMDLLYKFDLLAEQLTTWKEDTYNLLEHDDSLEDLRDNLLHVEEFLKSLGAK